MERNAKARDNYSFGFKSQEQYDSIFKKSKLRRKQKHKSDLVDEKELDNNPA